MSHASVLAILEGLEDPHRGSVKEALEPLMAPYEESPPDGSPFLVFNDKDAELREEYATMVFDSDYVKESYPDWFGRKASDVFETMEEFLREWHGYSAQRNSHDGRWGYWHNPDARWDWWEIGGRFADTLPVGSGRTIARVHELDWDAIKKGADEGVEDSWNVYQAYLDGVRGETLDKDMRTRTAFFSSWLSSMGLRHFLGHEDGDSLPTEDGWQIVDARPAPRRAYRERDGVIETRWLKLKGRVSGTEVTLLGHDEYIAHVRPAFRFSTYAVVHARGWDQCAQLGWWGMDDGSEGQALEWYRQFQDRFIKPRDPNDVLAVVDYHI